MSKLLRFAVGAIRDTGSAQFDVEVPAEAYQDSLSGLAALAGPMAVELDFMWRGGLCMVKGEVRGKWQIACSRCLVTKDVSYRGSVEGDYPDAASSVDVTEEVRQALLLALPTQVLCKPDCRGLCLRCGNNLNIRECSCK